MFSGIYNFFWGDLGALEGQTDLTYLKKERLFAKLSFLATTVISVFILLNYLNHKIFAMWFDFAIVLLLLVNARYFILRRNLNIAVFIFTSSVIILTSMLHFMAPHYLSGNVLWLPVMIFVSAFMSSRRYTLGVAIFGIVMFTLAYILPMFISIVPDKIPRINAEVINFASVLLSSLTILVIVEHIVAEEKRIQDVLMKGQEMFKRSSESSAALTALITHDLATPLMLIREQVKRLIDQSDQTQRQKIVGKVLQSTEQINELIEEVRSLRALESGKLKVTTASVHFVKALEEAIEIVGEQADVKGIFINLRGELEPLHSVKVLAERHTLVTSVLGNILSNAIKFSKLNSKIDIDVERVGEALICKIQDYGVGIDKEIKEHLFDFTVPTTRQGTAGEKGTGFGLPLVKMFIDRFKANIEVISRPEDGVEGSCFVLTFKIVK